jgi:hypothetical protein
MSNTDLYLSSLENGGLVAGCHQLPPQVDIHLGSSEIKVTNLTRGGLASATVRARVHSAATATGLENSRQPPTPVKEEDQPPIDAAEAGKRGRACRSREETQGSRRRRYGRNPS